MFAAVDASLTLAVSEGGLFPGAVFYLSMWFKRKERQFRVALFFSMASLAGAFGGILAYGIGFLDGRGGYKGWRYDCLSTDDTSCFESVLTSP